MIPKYTLSCFFFFNDTATTEIYTLSLHDALPISLVCGVMKAFSSDHKGCSGGRGSGDATSDRKSTRLNSSHLVISYAVFCLKKKKNIIQVGLPVIVLLHIYGSAANVVQIFSVFRP